MTRCYNCAGSNKGPSAEKGSAVRGSDAQVANSLPWDNGCVLHANSIILANNNLKRLDLLV
jgi:hypothetical protein